MLYASAMEIFVLLWIDVWIYNYMNVARMLLGALCGCLDPKSFECTFSLARGWVSSMHRSQLKLGYNSVEANG